MSNFPAGEAMRVRRLSTSSSPVLASLVANPGLSVSKLGRRAERAEEA